MQAKTILMKRLLLNGLINKNTINNISFKTRMITPNLLQQKLSKPSKAQHHLKFGIADTWKFRQIT